MGPTLIFDSRTRAACGYVRTACGYVLLLATVASAQVVTLDSTLQIGQANSYPEQGVHVLDGQAGPAVVSVLDGGQIATTSGTGSIVSGQSTLELQGGHLGGPIDVIDRGRLRLDAGGFDFSQTSAQIGFEPGLAIITASDQAAVDVRGGELDLYGQVLPFSTGIVANGQSHVAVSGGRLTAWNANTIELAELGRLEVAGGQIWNDDYNAVFAQDDTVVLISAGEVTGGEGGAAVRLVGRSQLVQTGGTLLGDESNGLWAGDAATAHVTGATLRVSDAWAVVVSGQAQATVVGSRLASSEDSLALAYQSGSLRLVDNEGQDELRGQHHGRLELIGNNIRGWVRLEDRSVADFQSGTLKSEGNTAWIKDDATFNLRGGTITRGAEALDDERFVDIVLEDRGNLNVYALQPTLTDDRLRGTFRDGTPFDLRLSLRDNARVVLHDLTSEIDFRADGVIDAGDIDSLGTRVRSAGRFDPPEFDVDDSGVLDFADVETLVHDFYGVDFGDANLDGYFDSADLIEVFASGSYDQPQRLAGWATGDWNLDTRFDSGDIVLAFQTGKYLPVHGLPAVALSVPEPKTGIMLGVAVIFFRRCRRGTARELLQKTCGRRRSRN